MISGIVCGILPDIYTSHLPILSDFYSGILSGMYSDILSGILVGIFLAFDLAFFWHGLLWGERRGETEDEERRRGEDEKVTKGGGHTLVSYMGPKRHSPIEQIIGSIQHTSNIVAPKQT